MIAGTRGPSPQGWPSGQRSNCGGGDVVVEAFGVVPRDEDQRVVPVFALGDRVDDFGDHRLGDLRVRVARMVVVAVEIGLHVRALVGWFESEWIFVPALDEDDAAIAERSVLDALGSPRSGRARRARSTDFREDIRSIGSRYGA